MNDPHTATLVREIIDLEYEITARSCELAERSGNGETVRLMYDPKSEVHPIYVEVTTGDERKTWPVPQDRGIDAFLHPYAYAP